MRDGAKVVASSLFVDGRLRSARNILEHMKGFDWFAAGSSRHREKTRLKALKYAFAVQIVLECCPNTAGELDRILKKDLNLGPNTSMSWLHHLVPLPGQSAKRQTTIYADIAAILSYFKRCSLLPGKIGTSLKSGFSLTKLVALERAHKHQDTPRRKATRPGQRARIRTLKSVSYDRSLKNGARIIVELELRNRSWHVLHDKVLTSPDEQQNGWTRVRAALDAGTIAREAA
jgi:hypothetical protein